MSNYKMETKCVQSGYNPGNGEPRVLPIVQSTTFRYTSSDQMGRLFDLEESGYFYTRLQFFLCAVWVYESCFHTHLADCVSKQIVCTAIQGRRAYDMITFFSNIHNRIKVCCLSGRSQHCCYSTLHITDLCCYCIIRRILKSCIKISGKHLIFLMKMMTFRTYTITGTNNQL